MSGRLERLWYPRGAEGWARRWALLPLAVLAAAYGLGVRLRNALYERGVLRAERLQGARVVSVGNLVVGGAGKTPAVIWLATWALARGRKVAVLSRGHGRRARRDVVFQAPAAGAGAGALPDWSEVGDEPLLVARRCPGLWLGVGPDRARLARRLRDERGIELFLLDDGFQHRRLARDVDLLVVDGSAPIGNGRLLPRGPLREPWPQGLARATALWWREREGPGTVATQREAAAELELERAAAVLPRLRVRHHGASLWREGREEPVSALAGLRALALAGLARPSGFLRALEAAGAVLVATRLFPDHHPFSPAELLAVLDEAGSHGAAVVTTEKDAVRVPAGLVERLCVFRQEVEVLEGEALLEDLLLGDGKGAA